MSGKRKEPREHSKQKKSRQSKLGPAHEEHVSAPPAHEDEHDHRGGAHEDLAGRKTWGVDGGTAKALDDVRLAMKSAQAAGIAAQHAMRSAVKSVESSAHSQHDHRKHK